MGTRYIAGMPTNVISRRMLTEFWAIHPKSEGPVWMAPALQVANRASGALVGCSLVSGLLMQSCMLTAGPDGIRELGPTLLSGL